MFPVDMNTLYSIVELKDISNSSHIRQLFEILMAHREHKGDDIIKLSASEININETGQKRVSEETVTWSGRARNIDIMVK